MRHSSALVLALPFLAVPAAEACEFCLLSQGISPLESVRGAGLRVNERYSLLDAVYQGTREVSNPGASEEFWTTDISAFYSVTPQLTVLVNLPMRVTQGDGDVGTDAFGGVDLDTARGGDRGLGDIALLGRYSLFTFHTLTTTTTFAAQAGVKLPTGDTQGHDDDGNFLDAHTQLGTGSTDALLGFTASHAYKRFSISTNLLAAITTEGESGVADHQFGDSINYDVTAKYRVSPAELGASPVQWFVSFGVNGEWRDREHENGVVVADSGGHVVYLTPGLQAIVNGKWIFEATFQSAVHHDLDGTQLGEAYKVAGSITYLF
jgi:hypothetical protein